MARTVNEAFETFIDRLTPTLTQRQAGASHRTSVKAALENNLDVRNFFETGSFSHGTGVRHRSDVDVLVSLGGSKPGSSYTALEWVKDVMTTRFPNTTVVIDRPAVKVKFGGGYETWEIIPGFVTAKGNDDYIVYDIPGASVGSGWIDTAPKAHLAYVNASNTKPHQGDAKDLARLIKAWKYNLNVPISSFYLEMRCAQHVASLTEYIHVWDVCLLLESLKGHELVAMNDPMRLTGRIHACSSDTKHDEALSKLRTAATRARKALDAHQADKPELAFYYLDLLFGGHFPSR